jgi:hypothetical protein
MVLGVPAEALTALTAGGAGVSALVGGRSAITAGLALAATALSASRAFLRAEPTYQGHQTKAAGYLALRNDVVLFRDLMLKAGRASEEDIEAQLQLFVARRNLLDSQAPIRIPNWAYRAAKKGIEESESSYETDPLWVEPPF